MRADYLDVKPLIGGGCYRPVMPTDRLPSLRTLTSSSTSPHGLRALGAEVIRRAIADATTAGAWLTEQTRNDARNFLTRRGHSGLRFWAQVLNVDAEAIRDHAQRLLAAYDEGEPARMATTRRPDFEETCPFFRRRASIVALSPVPSNRMLVGSGTGCRVNL